MFGMTAAELTMVSLALVSAATSATAAVEQGEAQKTAADYNAQVQKNAAKDSLQRGADSAAQNDQKTRRLMATQNAAMGANGLVTTSGTPLDILTGTAELGKLDSLRLLNNSQRDASGLTSQAAITQYQGGQAQTAGYLGGAGAVLGGASSAYFASQSPAFKGAK